MSVPVPRSYTSNESGAEVTVTEVTGNMSTIGPDYFALDELIPGDYIVDFADGSSEVVDKETLLRDYTESPESAEEEYSRFAGKYLAERDDSV